MNLLGWMKTGTKTVDDVFDKDSGILVKAGGWFDRLHDTDQEKAIRTAESLGKINQGVSDLVVATMSESTERSKTRRALAITWVNKHWRLVELTTVIAIAEFVWKQEITLTKILLSITFSTVLTAGTLAVLAFFFGSHMLSAHLNIPDIVGKLKANTKPDK